MSSIYRKGKTGFFYYQAYLYNPITGKKDKRIFHSLSTKDRIKALEKKKVYDSKYNKSTNSLPKIKYLKKIGSVFIIIVATLLIDDIRREKETSKKYEIGIKKNIETDVNIVKSELKKMDYEVVINANKKEKVELTNKDILSSDTNASSRPNPLIVTEIPSFIIRRIEKMPSSLKHIKVFATVQQVDTSKNLKLVCETIKREYDLFSSIVICLYLDTPNGVSVAKGLTNKFRVNGDRKDWIGMYTSNPVEGEYFDNDPMAYNDILKNKKREVSFE